MPQEPQCIYSINEGNTDGTDAAIKSAVKRFKHAKPNPYTLRYTGSLFADFHRTLAYGGIYLYPHDVAKPEGKLRVLYECGPLGFIIEQAGGFAMTSNYDGKGIQNILDIEVTTIHQRCPLIFGCKRDIDIIIEEYKNVAAKLGTALVKPITSPQGPRKFSTERVYTTFSESTSNDITKPRRESSNSLDDKIEYIV
jgi:fructose-1,6-bisphosphatase